MRVIKLFLIMVFFVSCINNTANAASSQASSGIALPAAPGSSSAASQTAPTSIDYRCLGDCVNSGKTSSVCMSQCSYVPAPSSTVGRGTLKFSPKEFVAPVPVDKVIIPARQRQDLTPPGMDYNCLAACHHANYQYQFCEQKCQNNTKKQ